MHKKIAATLLVTSALMLPSLSSAQSNMSDVDLSALEKTFPNRGACESTLKQLRNTVRQTVKATPVGSGQTNALINRLANPLVKFACTAVTQDGKTVFKIVEG
jgi:hypothetical protein